MNTVKVWEDNEGAIRILNGKRHARQRTRHLNVRYFFARDKIKSKEIIIEHKPTNDMIADLMTKPVGGATFHNLRFKMLGGKPDCMTQNSDQSDGGELSSRYNLRKLKHRAQGTESTA